MKKIVVFVCVLMLSATSFSQGFDFGIKLGANFANIGDASGFSNRTGLTGGIFAGIKFGDKLAIQPELLYSQQGAEFDGDKIDLTYVNIPVVIKYFLIKGLNLQLGPQFGFVVDDNVKDVVTTIGDANPNDVSGVVGVGYDLAFGLKLDGRYHFGFTDTFEKGSGKNAVFSLALGYSFL